MTVFYQVRDAVNVAPLSPKQPLVRIAAIGKMGSAPTNAAQGTEARIEMANGRPVRQGSSDIDTFGDAQGVFEFNAKVANCTIDLHVTK